MSLIFYKTDRQIMVLQDYKHYCEKGPLHHGKQIIMLCLNQECETKRLCCLTCIDHLHRKHELISLQKFEEMLAVLTHKDNPDIKGGVVALLKQFNIGLQKDLDNHLEAFSKFIGKCKEKAQSIIDSAIQSANLNFSEQHLNELYQNLNNQSVCRYLEYIKQAESEALKDSASTQKTLANATAIFERTNNEAQKHFTKGMDQVTASLEKLKKTLSQRSGTKPRLFSKTNNKAACIEVNNEKTLARRFQGSGSYPVVLMQQPLTQFNNSFTVTLKEQPGNKGCWLGVCVLDIVKNFNFASCYGIGKGSWAIDQVGASHSSAFSWSHHDSNFNSQPKGFQFHTGDTITVRVNFQKSTVCFERGQNVYQMPIQLELGQIYPFVGCTHLGDVWTIPSG